MQSVAVNVLRQQINVRGQHSFCGKSLYPAVNFNSNFGNDGGRRIRFQPELPRLPQRIGQCGFSALVANSHRLVAQTLRAGHPIKRRRQPIVAVDLPQQGVVLFMVVGVVDEDVEDHAPEKLFLLAADFPGGRHSAQQLRELRVAQFLPCGAQGDMR